MDRPYSLYDVLNVSPGARPAAIDAAYRALMKKYHPDRTGAGAGGRAAEINAAFSILRNPERRADYDRREAARQRAVVAARAAQAAKAPKRRWLTGWAAWTAAALVVCLATGIAADRYGDRLLARQRAAAHGPEEAPPPSKGPLDPGEILSQVLAEAAELTLRPRPTVEKAPPRAAVPAPPAAPVAPAAEAPRLRRHAEEPPRRRPGETREQAAERDFLEREGGIY
jgi:curved DNA-binding protein CbpA